MTDVALSSPIDDWPLPAAGDCWLQPFAPADADAWQIVLDRLPYQPVGYHRLHCDYQHAYFASAHSFYRRLDCLLCWRGEPVGVWPLAVFGRAGELNLSSHINGTRGVAPPLVVPSLSDKQHKTLTRTWLVALATLLDRLGKAAPAVLRFISPEPWTDVPDWHARLLARGGRLAGRYRIVADLALPEADYHRQIRKSYKSLINNALKLWHVELDDQGDAAAFAEFQHLHEQVAGRKTRPAETWDRQFEAIAAGAAFAIYLREPSDRLIGASLYNISRDAAYYAVGAYDRGLFDQPVAHLSLDRAVRHARATGRRLFVLGDRPFPGDLPPPSEKEARIAFFKEGFASSLQFLPALDIAAEALAPLTAENSAAPG